MSEQDKLRFMLQDITRHMTSEDVRRVYDLAKRLYMSDPSPSLGDGRSDSEWQRSRYSTTTSRN